MDDLDRLTTLMEKQKRRFDFERPVD